MTKYLETKKSSIEDVISSVVLGENGFVVGKVKMPKMKGGAKLQSKTNFDFRLFDPEDSPGSDKANDEMNREIVKASKMKDKATAMAHMNKIQRKHSRHGATDTEPREVISQVLNRVFGESVEIDEGVGAGKYSKMNLDKAKKLMGPSKNRKQGVMMVMKGLGTTYKHANQLVDKILGVNPKTGKIESAELGEGYESEVLKVLRDADIDGYFKMGKLYVSRRDARDVKKALEDSDEITKLPKMVMEETNLDEKFLITMPPVMGGKTLRIKSVADLGKIMKKLGATKTDLDNVLTKSAMTRRSGTRFQNASGKMFLVKREEVEIDEDERMKRLTPRQRQALARIEAKPKSQVSLPKMPDFMKPKKEENEMDIVDTIRNIVEKKLDPVNKDAVKKKFDDRKDKDIDNDGDVDSTDKYLHKRRKAISKAISKEAYDIGKDYAQHTLDVTPGQDKKDVDKMLNVAYTKNQSMRESLAKVWGLDEGKSPFQKEEEKPLTKTMTGQKPTTVKVNAKIEEK